MVGRVWQQPAQIEDLPVDVGGSIFEYLHVKEACLSSRTSRTFRDFATEALQRPREKVFLSNKDVTREFLLELQNVCPKVKALVSRFEIDWAFDYSLFSALSRFRYLKSLHLNIRHTHAQNQTAFLLRNPATAEFPALKHLSIDARAPNGRLIHWCKGFTQITTLDLRLRVGTISDLDISQIGAPGTFSDLDISQIGELPSINKLSLCYSPDESTDPDAMRTQLISLAEKLPLDMKHIFIETNLDADTMQEVEAILKKRLCPRLYQKRSAKSQILFTTPVP